MQTEFRGFDATPTARSTPGVRAMLSTMAISGGGTYGGRGNLYGPPSCALLLADAGVGITAVEVSYISGRNEAGHTVDGTGNLVTDPAVTGVGFTVGDGILWERRSIPAQLLYDTGRNPDYRLAGILRGGRGEVFAWFASIPTPPVYVPALHGSLDMDVTNAVLIALGILDNSLAPRASYSVTFTGDPSLIGMNIAVQGVVGLDVPRLSMAAIETLR